MSERAAVRTVACPTCGGKAVYAESNPWRPFCSERCRSVDLGAWASERFRIAEEGTAGDPVDDAGGAPPTASH